MICSITLQRTDVNDISIHQEHKPSAVEKMELAKMGLGLAELSFDYDEDGEHIHSVLVSHFLSWKYAVDTLCYS